MPRWRPFPIVGGSYADDTKPWSVQDTVNYLPVSAERSGTRSASMLKSAPGFTAFCDLGTGLPIRGAHNAEGLFLVVSGNTLFSVSPKGVATSLGTIPGVGRVSMAHNQITGGNQIAIANGLGGYVYDTTKSTLTQITDEGFVGAIDFDYVDSYIVGVESGKRFWFTSDLADATSYNTLDRYEAEGSPDKIMGLIVTHREVWVMGERTIEPFQNAGTAEGTFQRSAGMVMERGLASTFAMALLDNSVFWLGDDGCVYRANGYQPVRVSTFPIEQAIARCNMSQAFAFTFEDQGHKVFYLTLPDGHTWGYDVASGEWHRRRSQNLDRWRINTLTKWNGRWIAGDFSNGKLYQLDWDVRHEDGAPMERRRITGVTHDSHNALIINGVALDVDTGVPAGKGLAPITITGDLPSGAVGASGTSQYTAVGGWGAKTFAIDSGALPVGASMSDSGRVTYTYATAGVYSWRIKAVDELSEVGTLTDSAVVGSPWLVSYKGASLNGVAAFGDGSAAWGSSFNTGEYGWLYRDGSTLYISRPNITNGVNVSTNGGLSWNDTGATGTVSSGGGRMAFLGGYQYLCAGVYALKRRQGGAWSTLSTGPAANSIVAVGGLLITALSTDSKVSRSSDYGATWGQGTNAFQSSGIGSPLLATNGTRLVVFYNGGLGASYALSLKYSDDGGNTWSAAAYSFPNPDGANTPADLLWTGTRWIACTATGQVAYSDDAVTWTLSASTIGACNQMAAGNGTVLAACSGGLMYQSHNDGATWQALSAPSDNSGNSISGVAWVF